MGNVHKLHLVAGQVNALCTCCGVRQALVTREGYEEARRACPVSGNTYTDRGDGLYEPDTAHAPPGPTTATTSRPEVSMLLSDRPRRTGDKTRINLEGATFAGDIPQVFPKRIAGKVVHHTWNADLAAARPIVDRTGFEVYRLRVEAEEMVSHFPRWLLTLQVNRNVNLCRSCRGILVFDRGLRCVACDCPQEAPGGATVAWFGSLPPIGIEMLRRIREPLLAAPPDRHVVGTHEGIGRYILVPLIASYAPGFPGTEVHVSYLPGLFRVPGFPEEKPSHETHLLAQGRMCLFAPGQWSRGMTARQVIQQRAYPHVIKLLNYANGKTDAFAVVS